MLGLRLDLRLGYTKSRERNNFSNMVLEILLLSNQVTSLKLIFFACLINSIL